MITAQRTGWEAKGGLYSEYRQNATPNVFTLDDGHGGAIDLFFTSQGLCAEHYGKTGNISRREILFDSELLGVLKLLYAMRCENEKSAYVFTDLGENLARKVLQESGTEGYLEAYQILQ